MGVQDTNLSRLGQINKAGADDALFLKQFGGEVLTEFEESTAFKSRHYIRSITGGKTAQFPLIGSITSQMHTPGQWIDSNQIGAAEQTITIDGLLVAPIFVASIDEMQNHYDVRGPYATEMGRELAQQYDKNVARMHIKAARSASPLTGRAGGTVITGAAMSTTSDTLVSSLFTAAQRLDEKKVTEMDRFAYFRPAQFYLLVQNTKLLYKDYGGSADITKGIIKGVAGLDIIKTNNVPSTDLSADATVLAKYQGNYAKTVGIVASKWAVGSLHLADISMDKEYESRRQGTFMVSKMAVGHGILRPDCAIELADV